ncbi:MAG: site-2 protease family protein [Bacteroidota bacterium]|nr:site-2 protease family protein [Bacteroidota bacterium]
MENYSAPGSPLKQEDPSPTEALLVIPPKPPGEEPKSKVNIWLRSASSLALYLVLGYYLFRSFEMLLLITVIVVFHELGHFFAMKSFRYKDLGIFFIPLLGAYASGSKREVSQKESAIILLAGPLPGIVLGSVLYLLYTNNPDLSIAGISFYTISLSFIFLNMINLVPVYPLDGGQLMNRVFLDEESWVSKAFVFLSAGFLCWIALFGMDRPAYILLIFPAMMLFRMFGDSKLNSIEKKVETAGINLDTSYEDMPDTDYWKIRNMLIEEYPAFKDVPPAPPYQYDSREDKIMATIQSLLHRHLIQDVPLAGKIFLLIIWATAFAAPWLLSVDMSFLHRFGL